MRLGFRIQSKIVRWLMPSTSAALHPRHVQLLKCMTFSLVLLRHNVTSRWNLAAISSCQLIMSSQHSHVTFTNLLFASQLTFMLFEMERNGMNPRAMLHHAATSEIRITFLPMPTTLSSPSDRFMLRFAESQRAKEIYLIRLNHIHNLCSRKYRN